MTRKPTMASLWVFTPGDPDPDVEAMDARVEVVRSEVDRVNLTVRGKPGRRYEDGDSVWLEMTDNEALRLIGDIATTMTKGIHDEPRT
jgi:hypothetical protein